MPLKLEIVTPERQVFSDMVDHVVLPTEEGGEIDVLPGHIPLVTMIEPGELRFFRNQSPESIAIDKGFIEVIGDEVRVLTEAAIEVNQIDASQLEDARQEAERALTEAQEKGEDPAVLEELETRARFAVVQKIVSESKRG
ncbi:MAG: F-type H+-transporting ATPase subunit epsilon [Puniceicoccaceae bacterium 5H]|nr:MAG: F-type H+-transporting ATPase subunit epsilon [Puniceicoccaceae bacterium 5H]